MNKIFFVNECIPLLPKKEPHKADLQPVRLSSSPLMLVLLNNTGITNHPFSLMKVILSLGLIHFILTKKITIFTITSLKFICTREGADNSKNCNKLKRFHS